MGSVVQGTFLHIEFRTPKASGLGVFNKVSSVVLSNGSTSRLVPVLSKTKCSYDHHVSLESIIVYSTPLYFNTF